MFAKPTHRARLGTFATTLMIVTVGAWTLPAPGEENRAQANGVHGDGATMTIDINVPLNKIQDGQFCQAYALVYNGTPPYEFTWSGQFDNSDGSYGPLGEDQIVSGYVSSGRSSTLTLHVEDAASQTDEVTVNLQIGDYPYNSSCEA